jgi:hypothetical protein
MVTMSAFLPTVMLPVTSAWPSARAPSMVAKAVPHDRFDLRGRGHRRAGVAHHPHLLVGQQVGVPDGDPGAEHSLVVQPLERGAAGEDPLADVQVDGDVELWNGGARHSIHWAEEPPYAKTVRRPLSRSASRERSVC